jgi:2-aminoethylphosphonate-pyruvate transaminase
MLRDWCTWDRDYNDLVQQIRKELVNLSTRQPNDYTATLMQGSGTFSVEAVVTSAIPRNGKLLVISNGAYGKRIGKIVQCQEIDHIELDFGELDRPNMTRITSTLQEHPDITHISLVHCETTTGILNEIEPVAKLAKQYNKIFILDAMSSFGGIPFDVADWGVDYMISSANKCIQGVPGFGFVVARKERMHTLKGNARSLSLDLYDQWKTMEEHHGKWRFTSPTHTVRAFAQALSELQEEGGIKARFQRYRTNQKLLVEGMELLGFEAVLPRRYQSPIITSFYFPDDPLFTFSEFYEKMKRKGFVLYPGKVTHIDSFRIGTIGEVYPSDIQRLLKAIEETL